MPIVSLKFKLPEEQEEYKLHMDGPRAAAILEEVRNGVFRPARKHGYSDVKISALLDKLRVDAEAGISGEDLIGLLEARFYEIMDSYSD